MTSTYHKVMYYIKLKLWTAWHCDLRRVWDSIDYHQEMDRPFYHLCCNGNAGGWRTTLCNSLEDYSTGYRYHEEKLHKANKEKVNEK